MDKPTTDRRAIAVNDDRANGNTPNVAVQGCAYCGAPPALCACLIEPLRKTDAEADAERLTAIAERLETITPGQWVGGLLAHRDREDIPAYPYVGVNGRALFIADGGWGSRDDAEFIAHAPEDIAYLLAAVAVARRG